MHRCRAALRAYFPAAVMSCQLQVVSTFRGLCLECAQHGREELGYTATIDRLTQAADEHREQHR